MTANARFLLLASLSGCMLGPTDDQRVASTSSVELYWGYTVEPEALVQVRAWDFDADAMTNVGAPVFASSSPFWAGDMNLYEWKTDLALDDERFWRNGPAGGQCAVVGATTTLERGKGKTYDVMTVESDWGDCYADHPKASDFYGNCGSNNNPVAKLYTTTWNAIDVTQATLNLAGLVASPQFRINFDNYTPTAYEFCSASTPEGCPAGGASDPETWKYYRPNGSFIEFAGTTMTFSIEPSRADVVEGDEAITVYLDDMANVGAPGGRLEFRTDGDRFVLRINFEDRDPEVRLNCIRNGWCAIADGRTIDFTAPLFVDLRFALTVENGRVTYTDVVAKLANNNPDADDAADGFSQAITEKLMTDASIRDAVSSALDAVIRQSASLDPYTIEDVAIVDNVLRVMPGCPMD